MTSANLGLTDRKGKEGRKKNGKIKAIKNADEAKTLIEW